MIQVLDARDPEGTRSKWVEDEVRKREADGKRLMAVVNKIGEQFSFHHYHNCRLIKSLQIWFPVQTSKHGSNTCACHSPFYHSKHPHNLSAITSHRRTSQQFRLPVPPMLHFHLRRLRSAHQHFFDY